MTDLEQKLNRKGNILLCPTAIIVRENSILMGFRNYTPDKWKKISVWTTPGGRCEKNETVEQTLRREIKEETDIDELEIKEFLGETPGAKEGDSVMIFFCKTAQNFKLMEPEKFSEWKWIPIAEYSKGGPYSIMNPIGHKLVCEFLTKTGL
jgi:ADP-ribose pyrophosphatase YjhB (NUDIX family)